MSPVVRVRQLTKWYGPRRAVADVSFAVEPGEIIGLLGPNGSGKSTIFRILTGYLAPSSGTVEVAGFDVVRDAFAVRREVGYVLEDAPLYEHMRVVEFLRFMAQIKGLRGRAIGRAVDAAAARLDLDRVMNLTAGKLSRGFRQRVSIAQALLTEPKVLILDEPTSGLDPHQVIAVRDLIRSLAGHQSVLLASHVLSEIEKIASRVMILLDGTLLTADARATTSTDVRLRARISGSESEVRTSLAAISGVREVSVEQVAAAERHYLIGAEPGDRVRGEITRTLVAKGLELTELVEVRADLEQRFLDLTRRRSGKAAA